MIIHEIPYEVVERLFGTFIADNFNTINLILAGIGLLTAIFFGRQISFKIRTGKNRYDTIKDFEEEYQIPKQVEPTTYQSQHGEWSPTGWIYDRDTQKWNPPEYLAEDSAKKWRWDEEKRIWIDREKEANRQRYQEYWKDKRKEPTYEEWRAARMAEEQKKAPAPGPAGAGEPQVK